MPNRLWYKLVGFAWYSTANSCRKQTMEWTQHEEALAISDAFYLAENKISFIGFVAVSKRMKMTILPIAPMMWSNCPTLPTHWMLKSIKLAHRSYPESESLYHTFWYLRNGKFNYSSAFKNLLRNFIHAIYLLSWRFGNRLNVMKNMKKTLNNCGNACLNTFQYGGRFVNPPANFRAFSTSFSFISSW